MIRIAIAAIIALIAVPSVAQSEFVYKDDPFDSCRTISNNAPVRLTVYKCKGEAGPDRVSVLTTFRLGNSSLAPTRFMLRGGVELEVLDRPYPTLTSCNGYGSCNYISTVTFYIPFTVMFSEAAMKEGLQIKVFGMRNEEFILVSPTEIAELRAELIAKSFIKG